MSNNYYPTPLQPELLPNFRRTPPPEVLRAQIADNLRSVQPLVDEYASDIGLNLMLAGTGLGAPRVVGTALKIPKIQYGINAGVNALEGTKYGRPVVTKLRQAAENPHVKKAAGLLDYIF